MWTTPIFVLALSHVEPVQVKPEVETRTRFERRTDRDFRGAQADNQSDLHSRIRLGVSWKSGSKWSGLLQAQYAHTETWNRTRNRSTEASDLYQAFAALKENGSTLTIGRQKINVGSERLIGSLEWANVGRTFDAARFQTPQWDIFAGRIGVQASRPRNARLAAATYTWRGGSTSLILKQDRTAGGHVGHTTLAHTWKRKVSNWELDAEGAIQFGRFEGKDQRAWAVHVQASAPLSPKTRGTIEFNAASGGNSATQNRTFDNLYPTNHKFYGLMDLHAWKNMEMVAAGLSHSVSKNLELRGRIATSALRDPRDGWYGAGGGLNRSGSVVFRDATGLSGRDLGREIDLEAIWKPSKREVIQGGIAVFQPGTFAKKLSGDSKRQVWFYVQYGTRF